MSSRDADPKLLDPKLNSCLGVQVFLLVMVLAVGGTLKRLTPRASLQTLEQILTPKQLFEFENGEITGIKTYFVNSQSVKQNAAFLESRVSNCSLFKELARIMSLFQVEEVLVWPVCLEVLPKIYLSNIKKLFCLLTTSCLDGFMLVLKMVPLKWYLGVANYISVKNYVNIKFLQPNGPPAQLFRPSLEDICWILIHDIITQVDLPS